MKPVENIDFRPADPNALVVAKMRDIVIQWARWNQAQSKRRSSDSLGARYRNLRCPACYESESPCAACLLTVQQAVDLPAIVPPYKVEIAINKLPAEQRNYLRDQYVKGVSAKAIRAVYQFSTAGERERYDRRAMLMLANVLGQTGAIV